MPQCNDREYRGYNIASTYICPGLRVSTGIFVSGTIAGPFEQLETWIFSDLPQQRSTQRIHGTAFPHHTSERAKLRALAAHWHMVYNMRALAARLGVQQ